MIRLALFDVDGTLFLTDDPLMGDVLSEVVGVPNEIWRLGHLGKTIAWIARGLLDGADPPDGWCRRMEQRYSRLTPTRRRGRAAQARPRRYARFGKPESRSVS